MQQPGVWGWYRGDEEGTDPSHIGGPVWVTEWAQVTVPMGNTAEGETFSVAMLSMRPRGHPGGEPGEAWAAAEIWWLVAEAMGTCDITRS